MLACLLYLLESYALLACLLYLLESHAAPRNFDPPRTIGRSRLGLHDAPNFGRRGGNSSHAKSRATDSDFSSVGGISMLCLLALLYLLESYALLACFALPTRNPMLPRETSTGLGSQRDRGLVYTMRRTSGREEATLPKPNRELRTRNFRRRRISMLCFALLAYLLESYALLCLLTY